MKKNWFKEGNYGMFKFGKPKLKIKKKHTFVPKIILSKKFLFPEFSSIIQNKFF